MITVYGEFGNRGANRRPRKPQQERHGQHPLPRGNLGQDVGRAARLRFGMGSGFHILKLSANAAQVAATDISPNLGVCNPL